MGDDIDGRFPAMASSAVNARVKILAGAMATLVIAGCGSGGSGSGGTAADQPAAVRSTAVRSTAVRVTSRPVKDPLVTAVGQKDAAECIDAPDAGQLASTGITAWNSQVGFAMDAYDNRSGSPVTVESVSLIDPHNLLLRGAFVYEEPHSQDPLIIATGWGKLSASALRSSWTRRQRIPGAVIPPSVSGIDAPGPGAPDLYQVVLGITAQTPKGGWALGQQITYRQGGTQYTIRSYSGYALAPPAPSDAPCQAQLNAIGRAFSASAP
jgi:hypothetical protein